MFKKQHISRRVFLKKVSATGASLALANSAFSLAQSKQVDESVTGTVASPSVLTCVPYRCS